MENSTGIRNNNTKLSTGLGLNRLILSRQCDTPNITVDHSSSQKSSIISNGNSISIKESSSPAGALTRTLQQIGRFFNSGITSVSAPVMPIPASVTPTGVNTPAIPITRGQKESFSRDTLSPLNESFLQPVDSFSMRDSFGRTYSFTRCASFSHNNSFNNGNQQSDN